MRKFNLQREAKRRKASQNLINVDKITEYSLITSHRDEIVLFLIQPTNVSVLSKEGLTARIKSLMYVLQGFSDIEFLCLNSRESFENNKAFLNSRLEKEESPEIRNLLIEDLKHLDEIQSRTATSREFILLFRLKDKYKKGIYLYLNSLEKAIKDQNFSVKRADRDDLKRILAIYFSDDVISESYDDFDGQRWLIKDGKSSFKSSEIIEEANVLQSFIDMIAPATVKFEVDRYLVGNTFRCVWAIRSYPPSTDEQAILQRLGEKAGVSLHVYTRLVSLNEGKKIIDAAEKASRFMMESTSFKESINAQNNLQDVANMLSTAERNKEPYYHTAVYIEIIAKTEHEFSDLRDSVESELNRAKISVDKLHLCQQEGFISVMPSGFNALGEQFERMLPVSSVANLFPFAYTGKTDSNGFYIGYDKFGSSIITDLDKRSEDKSNANVLILGNSGQGKSYLLKLLLCNILESGKNIILLDPEHEYEDITLNLGGSYIDLTAGDSMINVLEPHMWSYDEDDIEPGSPKAFTNTSVLSQHISFLRDFFRSYKPFTDAQIDTIEIMLVRLYKKFKIDNTTNLSKLSSYSYPTLSDLYSYMEDEYKKALEYDDNKLYTAEILRSACLGLNSMCVGADAKFFNGHTNISSNRFITFGVMNLMESGKNIKDAMLFNVLSFISHALISGGNTAGIFEELHVFLSNPTAVSYIRNAMKRVRKRNSQLVLASQNIEDFLLPDVAEMTKPLFSIPTHHFLFHPGTIDKKDYMNALQLEPTEYKLITDCQTGSCLYKCGNERYNLVVKSPEHKKSLYGTGGGR